MQKGVAIFQLWEHKRWQAIIESYLFFLMGIYFVAETLSSKSEDDFPCPLKPGDAFWVWWCIIISGLSLMLVFRQEDLYLIPTILYTVTRSPVRCRLFELRRSSSLEFVFWR